MESARLASIILQCSKIYNILLIDYLLRFYTDYIAIPFTYGWSNPDQALTSMIAIRDTIGLTYEQVTIVDARTGNRY